MEFSTFSIPASSDNLSLSILMAQPLMDSSDVAVKALVVIIHGMCEHKERYCDFMEYLAENGIASVCNDLRGHGASVKSKEDLGYFYDGGYKAMIEDEKLVLDWAKSKFPGVPVILLGHSMGSLVARCVAKKYDSDIDMLFVSGSPSDNPAKGIGRFLAKCDGILRGRHHRPDLLQKMSFGAYNKPFADEGYRSAWVCSDKKILDAYHSDPLCQYVFTSSGWYGLLGLMQECYSPDGWAFANNDLPVVFISGENDPCYGTLKQFGDAVALMKKIGYHCKSRMFPGMRHEVLNETNRLEVYNYIIDNIESILK